MKKTNHLIKSIGLVIALAATLPVSADERDAHANPAGVIAQPVTSKAAPKPLDGDIMQGMEAPAAGNATKNQEKEAESGLPYVTFDGASDAN